MSNTNIGNSVYVAAALPAANNAAGFEALTWIEVAGAVSAPSLGISNNNIDVPNLKTGFTTGLKGAASGTDNTFTFQTVSGDAGQAALIAAALAQGTASNISVKIVRGTGVDNAPVAGDNLVYAQGYAHSYQDMERTDSSYEGFTANFKQNAEQVYGTEPA